MTSSLLRLFAICLAADVLLQWTIGHATSAPLEQSRPKFDSDIRPILAAHCWGCHGADKQEGQLDLRSIAAIARGGESGPAVAWGQPAASLILKKIIAGEMPPEDGKKLSGEQVAILRQWIAAGPPAETPAKGQNQDPSASSETYWAFQKLQPPPVPDVRSADRARTPIDRFLLAKLRPGESAFRLTRIGSRYCAASRST